MQNVYQTFHVGINVFVVRGDQLLLWKRRNVYSARTWNLPGGHLETDEGMKDAAARELMEETGLSANVFTFSNIVNDRTREQHYLQIGFVVENVGGEPLLKEPHRYEEWRWFKFNEIPHELFPPHVKQIDNFPQRLNFVDA